jgi:hypothetical protein
MIDRVELITKYFKYLVSDYGFIITQQEFDYSSMGNAFVIFKSPRVGVEVVIDRNQVLITIGDEKDNPRDWFEFSSVLNYFSPLVNAYEFPDKTEINTWDGVVETQLDRLSIILLQYCEPILKGDLTMKKDIQRIQEKNKAKLLVGFKTSKKYQW